MLFPKHQVKTAFCGKSQPWFWRFPGLLGPNIHSGQGQRMGQTFCPTGTVPRTVSWQFLKTRHAFSRNTNTYTGVFLEWWYPQKHPKNDHFLVGKTHGLFGYHHFEGKPLYSCFTVQGRMKNSSAFLLTLHETGGSVLLPLKRGKSFLRGCSPRILLSADFAHHMARHLHCAPAWSLRTSVCQKNAVDI